MKLVGSGEQQVRHFMFDASGTIASGGTAQLVLPEHQSRSLLLFTNNSTANLTIEFGSARATCAISNGAVTSGGFTITNAGFNFTKPPIIRFLGGGYPQVTLASGQPAGYNSSYVSAGGPNFPTPPNPAQAHAVLSAGAVSSIVLDNAGSNYAVAPMVFFINSDLDPNGCALPSASSGYAITPNGSMTFNGTCCPTDAMAIYGANTGQAFTCKYMT